LLLLTCSARRPKWTLRVRESYEAPDIGSGGVIATGISTY
jgi:hypothetical protein